MDHEVNSQGQINKPKIISFITPQINNLSLANSVLLSNTQADQTINNNLIYTNATKASEEETKSEYCEIKPRYVRWTPYEDRKLKEIVKVHGAKNWQKISEFFSNKTTRQCIYRWYKVLKPCNKEEIWLEEEDALLVAYIKGKGRKNWTTCAKMIGNGRSGRSCKDRWYNVLSLLHDSESFTPRDDLRLLLLVSKLGTKWSLLIRFFPNKSENQIKNRCYSLLKKCYSEQISKTIIKNASQDPTQKSYEFLKFLPDAIMNLKLLLGKDTFDLIYRNVFSSVTSTPTSTRKNSCNDSNPCNIQRNSAQIVINVCNTCKTKLKEHLKKKLMAKILQNSIPAINGYNNAAREYNLDFNSANRINPDPSNINILLNKFASTSSKIEALKDILSSFTQNLSV